MCFERTKKKIEPFFIGYKVMRKENGRYSSSIFRYLEQGYPKRKWLDEMPYREKHRLLKDYSRVNVGWHIFSTLRQARGWKGSWEVIVRVECYGLAKPYGLGLAYGKPAGRFQFMRIIEEVK